MPNTDIEEFNHNFNVFKDECFISIKNELKIQNEKNFSDLKDELKSRNEENFKKLRNELQGLKDQSQENYKYLEKILKKTLKKLNRH